MPATPGVTANMSPDIAYQVPLPPAENPGLYQKGDMVSPGGAWHGIGAFCIAFFLFFFTFHILWFFK